MAFSAETPPLASAGKNFTRVRPKRKASSTSVGVATPGMTGTPRCLHHLTTSGFSPGETMNWAPALTAFSACAGERIVPAPQRAFGTPWAMRFNASSAAAVRKTTSTTGRPPATRASARASAPSALGTATTGTTRTSFNFWSTEASFAASAGFTAVGRSRHQAIATPAPARAPAIAPAAAAPTKDAECDMASADAKHQEAEDRPGLSGS
mmetsp:Transcript_87161/g.241679  ORF Transcript_87161/g.241679 Transcript_87161/m.241679 type:complete len:209 (+) Transcript_87161:341-967(+)